MNLDFFNHLTNDVKDHSIALKFIDELTEYLNNIKKDILKPQDLAEFLNTNELMSKYKISATNKWDFYKKQNEILKEYSKTLGEEQSIFYVSWNNNINDKYNKENIYTINQYTQGKLTTQIYITRQRLT